MGFFPNRIVPQNHLIWPNCSRCCREPLPEEHSDKLGYEAHREQTAGGLVWRHSTLSRFLLQDLRHLVVVAEQLKKLLKATFTARQKGSECIFQNHHHCNSAVQCSKRRAVVTCSWLWWSYTPLGPHTLPSPAQHRCYSSLLRWIPWRTLPTCPIQNEYSARLKMTHSVHYQIIKIWKR